MVLLVQVGSTVVDYIDIVLFYQNSFENPHFIFMGFSYEVAKISAHISLLVEK
jgi:hypothetical protein